MNENLLAQPASWTGQVIHSQSHAGVTYQLDRLVSDGQLGATYLGSRRSAEGTSPVVVKVMRGQLVGSESGGYTLAAKEVVALGRLNDLVPPIPYVVRLLDFGVALQGEGTRVPWTAVEYVHGGALGTTLQERVAHCLNTTGYAFEPARVLNLLGHLGAAFKAIHAVDVIHRDLSPSNILCCGADREETFKVSDFGVARIKGTDHTFKGVQVGTLGYSAPEAHTIKASWGSDVFSLGAVTYFALTGHHCFNPSSPLKVVAAVLAKTRPSILDHVTLHPELQHREDVVREVDEAIALATAADLAARPASAREFVERISSVLRTLAPPRSGRISSGPVPSSKPEPSRAFSWTVRSKPKEGVEIASAAFNTSGHVLGLTPAGATFFNGYAWANADRLLERISGKPTRVWSYGAVGWLVDGDGPTLSIIDSDGVRESVEAPLASLRFLHVGGDLEDVFVGLAEDESLGLSIWTYVARRWLKPWKLKELKTATVLARLDSDRWIIGGESPGGTAFVAIADPLNRELVPVPVSLAQAPIAAAGGPDARAIVIVPPLALRLSAEGPAQSTLPAGFAPTHAVMDSQGREWLAAPGQLYCRSAVEASFAPGWSQPEWSAPFRALLASDGMVLGVTSDGAIVEGRTFA
jgi:eukaryotic-like serine/threonine-protein kinase